MVLGLFCTLLYVFFIFIDLIPLFQRKKWKSFWSYIFLIVVSYTLHFLFILDVDLPSPNDGIERLVDMIFNLLD